MEKKIIYFNKELFNFLDISLEKDKKIIIIFFKAP